MAPTRKYTDDDVTFDDLMSQMGVRRMGQPSGRQKKARETQSSIESTACAQ